MRFFELYDDAVAKRAAENLKVPYPDDVKGKKKDLLVWAEKIESLIQKYNEAVECYERLSGEYRLGVNCQRLDYVPKLDVDALVRLKKRMTCRFRGHKANVAQYDSIRREIPLRGIYDNLMIGFYHVEMFSPAAGLFLDGDRYRSLRYPNSFETLGDFDMFIDDVMSGRYAEWLDDNTDGFVFIGAGNGYRLEMLSRFCVHREWLDFLNGFEDVAKYRTVLEDLVLKVKRIFDMDDHLEKTGNAFKTLDECKDHVIHDIYVKANSGLLQPYEFTDMTRELESLAKSFRSDHLSFCKVRWG